MQGKKRANGEGSWDTCNRGKIKYYRYRIYDNTGKVHAFYGKTRKEAEQKYKSYLSKNPIYSSDEIQTLSFYLYVSNWLNNWRKKNISPKTFDYYEQLIENHIKNMEVANLQIYSLNSKNQKEVKRLFQEAVNKEKNKSASFNNGIYTILSQVCKYGVNNSDFSFNYMNGVEKLTEKDVNSKRKIKKSLDYDQVMCLWKEMTKKNTEGNIINGKEDTYVYGINSYALLFCCFTGLRWGEVSRLEWSDIKKTENNSYYIVIDKQFVNIKDRDQNSNNNYKYITKYPKEEKIRYIPLSNKSLEILDMVKKRFPENYNNEHLIFSTTNNPVGSANAGRTLKSMCKAANLPILTPHELRHTFASILLNQDTKNLYAVSDLLGHSTPDITYKAYIDIFEKTKMDTIKIFDNMKKGEE